MTQKPISLRTHPNPPTHTLVPSQQQKATDRNGTRKREDADGEKDCGSARPSPPLLDRSHIHSIPLCVRVVCVRAFVSLSPSSSSQRKHEERGMGQEEGRGAPKSVGGSHAENAERAHPPNTPHGAVAKKRHNSKNRRARGEGSLRLLCGCKAPTHPPTHPHMCEPTGTTCTQR